jgi:hypothetical protein
MRARRLRNESSKAGHCLFRLFHVLIFSLSEDLPADIALTPAAKPPHPHPALPP